MCPGKLSWLREALEMGYPAARDSVLLTAVQLLSEL